MTIVTNIKSYLEAIAEGALAAYKAGIPKQEERKTS